MQDEVTQFFFELFLLQSQKCVHLVLIFELATCTMKLAPKLVLGRKYFQMIQSLTFRNEVIVITFWKLIGLKISCMQQSNNIEDVHTHSRHSFRKQVLSPYKLSTDPWDTNKSEEEWAHYYSQHGQDIYYDWKKRKQPIYSPTFEVQAPNTTPNSASIQVRGQDLFWLWTFLDQGDRPNTTRDTKRKRGFFRGLNDPCTEYLSDNKHETSNLRH